MGLDDVTGSYEGILRPIVCGIAFPWEACDYLLQQGFLEDLAVVENIGMWVCVVLMGVLIGFFIKDVIEGIGLSRNMQSLKDPIYQYHTTYASELKSLQSQLQIKEEQLKDAQSRLRDISNCLVRPSSTFSGDEV